MLMIFYIFFQIVGESFPISSSGHVTFLQNVYYFLFPHAIRFLIPLWFDYCLHIPTILVVFYYFFPRFSHYLYSCVRFPAKLLPVMKAIIITDLITTCCYMGKEYGELFPLWAGFFITGCALYSLRYVSASARISCIENLSLKNIFIISVAQCISLLPGVSRLGLTFVAARWQGLGGMDSFFYSFLIALPLFGAAGLKGIVSLVRNSNLLVYEYSWWMIGVSIVLATILSYYSFKVMEAFIRTCTLWYISYYMCVLSVIVGIFSMLV